MTLRERRLIVGALKLWGTKESDRLAAKLMVAWDLTFVRPTGGESA